MDTFVFEDGAGVDRIREWEDSTDLIDVTSLGGFGAVTSIGVNNGNTEIAIDGELIVIIGFTGTIDVNVFV